MDWRSLLIVGGALMAIACACRSPRKLCRICVAPGGNSPDIDVPYVDDPRVC